VARKQESRVSQGSKGGGKKRGGGEKKKGESNLPCPYQEEKRRVPWERKGSPNTFFLKKKKKRRRVELLYFDPRMKKGGKRGEPGEKAVEHEKEGGKEIYFSLFFIARGEKEKKGIRGREILS